MHARGSYRALVAIVVLGLWASACGTVTPSPAPASLSPAASSPTAADARVGPGPLDACDPAALLPCEQQAAFLSIPIPDTGAALTWSSQWAAGRTDRSGWDADSLGLGGWSLDVIQRYQASDQALIGGDGSWRFASGVKLASGGLAVPSYDGSLAYVFDAAGRHVRTVDGLLGATLLTVKYDANGRLQSVDGTAAGHPVQLAVARAADGSVQALTGIDGARTSLQLDAKGRLSALTEPAGPATSFAWGPGDLVASETDPLGGVQRFSYDQNGLLVGSSDADGVTEQYTRTATPTSVETDVTTALGRATKYRMQTTAAGTVRTFILPGGATTTETTATGGSISLVEPDGTKRTIDMEPSTAWGAQAPVPASDVTVRPDGVTSTTAVAEALSEVGGLPYQLAGTITTTTNGARSVETIDPATRQRTLVDATGRTSAWTFDEADRVVTQAIPGSPIAAFAYDANGREASVTVGAGSTAQTTRYAYDPQRGAVTETRPDGSKVDLVVDAQGDVTKTASADGSTMVGTYDATGRLTQVQPAGGLSFTMGYSAAGRPTFFLPPAVGSDTAAETTTYDADGLPMTIKRLDGQSVNVTYDDSGQPTSWTVAHGTATAAYDPTTGLETKSTDPGGATTAYAYSGSTPAGLSWTGPVGGAVAESFDANGQVSADAIDGASGDTWTYDGAGNLTGIDGLALARDPATGLVTGTRLGVVRTSTHSNDLDQLVGSTTTTPGSVLLDDHYTRDALGRITAITERTASGTTTTSYTYDGSDRLSSVTVNGKVVERDTYDAAGNRISTTSPAGTILATYDARDRLETWDDRTYRWTASGALASIAGPGGAQAFNYDQLGYLRSVQLPGDKTITYVVDADGRRIGREVGGSLEAGYLYDPSGQLVAETDGSGAVVARFAYDDAAQLALVTKGSKTYRVIVDPVGSPRLVIDSATGAVAEAIDYNAWGQVVHDSAPGFMPVGFGGGLVDPDTGLVHFGARDYDPGTGRWTSSDPARFGSSDPNLYRYASDDAINRQDPTGLGWSCEGANCKGPGISCTRGACGSNNNGGWGCVVNGACSGPNGGCFNGWCGGGPNGFHCHAEMCYGPDRQQCNDCNINWGDTHLLTADGTHYDFQAAGEFVDSVSPDQSLEIQSRQQPILGGTLITFNTAVAALVDGDRVGVYADEPSFLVVNGKSIGALDIAEQLPHGGAVERHGGLVTVTWSDGSQLAITQIGRTLDYLFAPSKAIGPSLKGLLGSTNGNAADDLTGRDGPVLSRTDTAFNAKLYSQFGASWRISPAESLFDYRSGESTATFTNLTIPSAEVMVASLSPSALAMAQSICAAAGVRAEPILDDCLIDVGMTGDPTYAAGSAAVAAAGLGGSASTSTETSPGQVTPITIGHTVSGTIASAGDDADYTFTGTTGEAVYLQAHDACVGILTWDLLAPGGGDLGGSLTCHDLERVVLPSEGTYTVRVNGEHAATGAYSFTVLAVPQTVVTPVQLGGTVSGSLSSPGQQADYSFNGASGQAVYLEHGATCTATIESELISPSGAVIASTSSCTDLDRVDLPASGAYTIHFAGDRANIGPYGFSLLPVPATVVSPIAHGQTVSGTLANAGQRADYTFSAAAGETLHARALGPCVDGLEWQLLSPTGAPLDFGSACHDLGPDTLATAGTFTLRELGTRTATGAYSFVLDP